MAHAGRPGFFSKQAQTQGPPVEQQRSAAGSRSGERFRSCLTHARVVTAVAGGERVLRIRLHLLPRPIVRSGVFEDVRAIGRYREACPDMS